METPTPQNKKSAQWVKRLGFSDRQLVVQMYSNGVGISAITNIYQIHHSSVRYHLKKAGVYVKGKYGSVNMPTIKKYNPGSTLDFYNTKGLKIRIVRYSRKGSIEDESEKNFPGSYREYVQREKDRNSILSKHGITNVRVKLPNPDIDTDAFFPRRKFDPAYIEKRRAGIKIEDTDHILLEDTKSI